MPWHEADRLLAAGRLEEALALLDWIGARTDAAIVRLVLAQRQGLEPWATRGRGVLRRGRRDALPARRSTRCAPAGAAPDGPAIDSEDRDMPTALYFTDEPEACKLLARIPFALLVGFAIDQQVTVPKAFAGPYVLKQRAGTLDPKKLAAMDLAAVLRGEAGDPPLPRRDGRSRARARRRRDGGVRR